MGPRGQLGPYDDFLFCWSAHLLPRLLSEFLGLEYLQILIHIFGKQLIILLPWLIDIPHSLAVVIPDMGTDPLLKIGVCHLLFPKQIREAEDAVVHLARNELSRTF